MTTTAAAPPKEDLSVQVLARLDRLEAAVQRLTSALEAAGTGPAHPPGYKHLEYRPHRWRRQPYLPGVRLTVLQLVATMNVNRWTPEEAACQYSLPVEAVREAMDFADRNKELLEYETLFERYSLEKRGVNIDTPVIPEWHKVRPQPVD